MSDTTAIEWCDSTFNPWVGCTRVSPACDDCYAARSTPARAMKVQWGAGQPRHRTAASTWKKPLQWNREDFYECRACGYRFGANEHELRDLPAGFGCPECAKGTLRLTRRRVFCASLADVFDNEAPIAWFVDLMALVRATPNLDWLLLTKRIGNFKNRLDGAINWIEGTGGDLSLARWLTSWRVGSHPPENVWLGATVANQDEADRDIQKLLAVQARVRFLSCEPLLGKVLLDNGETSWLTCNGMESREEACASFAEHGKHFHGIDWVIAGGESGPKARPVHIEWVEALVEQCRAAGVPCMVKQLGNAPAWSGMGGPWPANTRREDTGRGHFTVSLRDRKGGDIAEWPERLRVRQFPVVA